MSGMPMASLAPFEIEQFVRDNEWLKGAVNYDEDLHFSSFYLRASCVPSTGALYPGYSSLIAFYEGFNESYYLLKSECLATARAIVQHALRDPAWLPGIIDEIRIKSDVLTEIFDADTSAATLAKLPPRALLDLYRCHHAVHQSLYQVARLPEALDRGVSYFTSYLQAHLAKIGVPPDKQAETFHVLTQPVVPSVLAEEMLEMDEIVEQVRADKELLGAVLSNPAKARMVLRPDLLRRLEAHQEKWQFLAYHGYGSRQPTTLSQYVERLVEELKGPTSPINSAAKRRSWSDARRTRTEILERLQLDLAHRRLFEVYPEIGAAKLYRRHAQLRNFYYLDMLLAEIAKRIGVNEAVVRCMLPEEIVLALTTGKPPDPSFIERTAGCACVMLDGKEQIWTGEQARRLHDLVKAAVHHGTPGALYGAVACKGKATGPCKVVIRAHDRRADFPAGAILVSESTDPDLVGLMRKAGAVLTEQGGVTCHAAIICRELGIPTIIGIAGLLQRVHDGDLLEVDANSGRVHIIDTDMLPPREAVGIYVGDESSAVIGAKARNLGVIRSLGFSVPDYVVLDPKVVRRLVTQPLEHDWQQLTHWIGRQLSLTDDDLLAIRSSSSSEDLDSGSHAGEYHSLLRVPHCQLITGLREFIESNHVGQNGTGYQGSILVQRMVLADCSGVCLTLDQRLGKENGVIIEWLAGSNEPLTSGTASPARAVVDRFTGDILEDERGADAPLDDLAGMVRRFLMLEARFGKPLDIEWALADQKLHILQARPIVGSPAAVHQV